MPMRREMIIGLVLMLVLSSLTIISGNVSAEIKKEDMTWSIGDKWEFRYTILSGGTTMVFKMAIETTSESVVEIDGVNYEVFVAELDGEMEAITAVNLSLVDNSSTITGTLYAAKDSDTTKTVEDIMYQLREETTGTIVNQKINIVTISRVISGEKPDVIDIGTNWVYTVKTETTTITTVSGSFYDNYYAEPGYTNTTSATENNTETINYECTGKKNINTTAGTFETYEIEGRQVGQQGYTLRYISPIAKEDIKDITYDNDGNIVSLAELISYDVATASSPTPKTPGFELAIVLCSIAIILLWKRKRMN
jgi:hypothetical protein